MKIWIEETWTLLKAKIVIKENVKISKYQNIKESNSSIQWGRWTCVVTYNLRCYLKIHGYINFCPLLLVRDILSIRDEFPEREFNFSTDQEFFPGWKREVLEQLDPHRYLSGNWWKLCKNGNALGIK